MTSAVMRIAALVARRAARTKRGGGRGCGHRLSVVIAGFTLAGLFASTPAIDGGPTLAEPASAGDATIRGVAGSSEITIRTTSRLAGAIDSLTWNGKEFIDSFDHGRQLQSAASFDGAAPRTF